MISAESNQNDSILQSALDTSLHLNRMEIAEFTSILQRVNYIGFTNSQLGIGTSIQQNTNSSAERNKQQVTECSILPNANVSAESNLQNVTELSILPNANDSAETNQQNVAECSILQNANDSAEPFTQIDPDFAVFVEESPIPQNVSRIEYTPNGVDEIVRTPGGTYKHTTLNTLVNPFQERTPQTSTRLESLIEGDNDEDETEDIRVELEIEPPQKSTVRATRGAVAKGTVSDYCPLDLQYFTKKYVTQSAAFDPKQKFTGPNEIGCGCLQIGCSTIKDRKPFCYYCRREMNSYCSDSGFGACCRECFLEIHTEGNTTVNVGKKSKFIIIYSAEFKLNLQNHGNSAEFKPFYKFCFFNRENCRIRQLSCCSRI